MQMSDPQFKSFSKKQLRVLRWWASPDYKNYDGIICDGAVRSGKTLCMTVSFVTWASLNFNKSAFAICGKTIASVRRNIVTSIFPLFNELGIKYEEKLSQNLIEVSAFGHTNHFWLFGGRDESSASLIQGMTLSGVMLDEVALMPRSFVEQALARCSVKGAKFWFNCNPEHPMHWFCEEWIKKAEDKNCLYIHFTMRDNPSLTSETLERYEKLYTGVFHQRYILGLWVAAQGCVYPMFSMEKHVCPLPDSFDCYYISCDYGTVNPSSFGLWGRHNGVWYRLKEYYYDSRETGERRTDGEHYEALVSLAGGLPISAVIVDPSAASFIELIIRRGRFSVIKADNNVIDGIRRVQDALREGKIKFSENCKDSIREFGLYRWKSDCVGDAVIKENDHAMDDIRYFVQSIVLRDPQDGFFVGSVGR